LVKDNIATDDQMQTTAGSFAIYGNHVPGDAVIIQQLSAARTHARTTARTGRQCTCRRRSRRIVAPHLTNSTGPAVSGYPNISIPVGIRDSGRPAGMLMYSTFLFEPQLIGLAYDLEQEINVRQQPQFLGSVIPIPNADLCNSHQNRGRPHLPHGRIV
jgi:Asp-tRNA(Asn)/Glu-tRNA(Gln) amidotransferase A subunit family amidase